MTRIIGLTGNIASGKSTVAGLLRAHGATIVDADALARDAVAPGTAELARIAARWPHAVAADGTLDREALRTTVFTDAAARRELDGIVHPAVARLAAARFADARARADRVVIYDVPLLFEANLEHTVDEIILVDAPAALRHERLVRDRGLAPADATAMIAAQMPSSAKRPRADYIIDNAGTRDELAREIDRVWRALARTPPPD